MVEYKYYIRVGISKNAGKDGRRMRKALAVFLLLLTMVHMCGCGLMPPETLYTLPKISADYEILQGMLNTILDSGAVYSAPTAGSNRQTVQMEDLDSDGEKEVLAFFNFPGDDKPLKIYIFRSNDGVYEQAAVIEGEGSSFENISYVDMDGDGISEVVVGRQISADLKMLSIYSIRDYQISQIVASDYMRYAAAHLRSDTRTDVLVLRKPTAEADGEAEMFSLDSNGDISSSVARMTSGVETISRVRVGLLSNGTTGIYVESVIDGSSLVTDIFTYNRTLTNITNQSTGDKPNDTVRTVNLYCQDIDNDGVLEVPSPVAVLNADGSSYWQIRWDAYSSSGRKSHVMTTYHNTSDGWYFILPEAWEEEVGIRRLDAVSGERTIVLSYYDGETETNIDFLKIYALSGSNREAKAILTGRFPLKNTGDVVYAAEILEDVSAYGIVVTEESVKSSFNVIYSEWETGESS